MTLLIKRFAFLLLCCISQSVCAQSPLSWNLLAGIEGGPCHSASYDPESGALFIVMVDGLYRSTSEGDQWEKVLDLEHGSFNFPYQHEVDAWAGRVAVIRYQSGLLSPLLYYSENNGTSWTTRALPPGTCSTTPIGKIVALFNDWILLNFGDGVGVYYSTDGGQNWTEPTFFQSALFSTASPPRPSLIRSEDRLYLYSFFQIYYNDGDPEVWDTLPLPPGVTNPVFKFANRTKVLIADGNTGLFYASDNTGESWTPVTPHPSLQSVDYWYGQKEDTLLMATGAIYRSVFPFTDAVPENGLAAPEYPFSPIRTDHYLVGIRLNNGGLFASPGSGLNRVRLDGAVPTYSYGNKGLPDGTAFSFFSSPKGMLALGPTGIFRHNEAQVKWDTLWQSTEMPPEVRSVVAIEDTFWIIANSGQLFKAVGEGSAFQQDLSYILYLPSDIPLSRLEFRDEVLYLFNPYRSLYSLDSARTWKPIEDPWPFEFYQNIVGANGHFLAIYRNPFGVLQSYMTHDWGASWTFLPDVKPDSEDRIYFNEGRFFAFDDFFNDGFPFLWYLPENETQWSKAFGTLPPTWAIGYPVIFSNGKTLYFGQLDGNLYATVDNGLSWASVSGPTDTIPITGMICLGEHEGYLYLGTGSLGVWRAAAPVRTTAPPSGPQQMVIYPNPAHDEIRVTSLRGQAGPFVVYDGLGRKVREGLWQPGQNITLHGIPAGVYWIWIQGEPLAPFYKN